MYPSAIPMPNVTTIIPKKPPAMNPISAPRRSPNTPKKTAPIAAPIAATINPVLTKASPFMRTLPAKPRANAKTSKTNREIVYDDP